MGALQALGLRKKAHPDSLRASDSDVQQPYGVGALNPYTNGVPMAGTPANPGARAGVTTGWRGMPGVQNASSQIGLFDGQLLNQYPARVDGVQLHGGREWGSSHWYYPSLTPLPNGNLQQTTHPNNITGGQRYGSIYSGQPGPLSVKANSAQLAAQQVRQSGLQAMQWAQNLYDTGQTTPQSS